MTILGKAPNVIVVVMGVLSVLLPFALFGWWVPFWWIVALVLFLVLIGLMWR